MASDVAAMVEQFVAGRLTRRELVWSLTALVAAAAGAPDAAHGQQRSTTFEALGLNHPALRVTDLARSQAFYERPPALTGIRGGALMRQSFALWAVILLAAAARPPRAIAAQAADGAAGATPSTASSAARRQPGATPRAANPWLGKWTMNPAKSTYSGPAPKSAT